MTLNKRLWGGLFLALFLFIASCAQTPSPTTSPATRAITPPAFWHPNSLWRGGSTPRPASKELPCEPISCHENGPRRLRAI